MTPRTNSIIQGFTSAHHQLATRRIDTSDTYFGFSVMASLHAWSSASGPSTLLAVYAVERGFVVGSLRFGESARCAQYTLHRVGSAAELSQLVSSLMTRGTCVGICASENLGSETIEQLLAKGEVSTRSTCDLACFRRDTLRREDFFDDEFRQAMLQDAFDLGGLCSEQAVEIAYADLMTLMLSGPDVRVRH